MMRSRLSGSGYLCPTDAVSSRSFPSILEAVVFFIKSEQQLPSGRGARTRHLLAVWLKDF